jgi:hypothetical protein
MKLTYADSQVAIFGGFFVDATGIAGFLSALQR